MAANEAGHVAGRAFIGQDGVFNPNASDVQVCSADGAITITNGKVVITKASAAALTLANPTAGDNDGHRLLIVSTTAQAHTVTPSASPGINGLGASGDLMTWGAAIGNVIELMAHNGAWYKAGTQVGVTIS